VVLVAGAFYSFAGLVWDFAGGFGIDDFAFDGGSLLVFSTCLMLIQRGATSRAARWWIWLWGWIALALAALLLVEVGLDLADGSFLWASYFSLGTAVYLVAGRSMAHLSGISIREVLFGPELKMIAGEPVLKQERASLAVDRISTLAWTPGRLYLTH